VLHSLIRRHMQKMDAGGRPIKYNFRPSPLNHWLMLGARPIEEKLDVPTVDVPLVLDLSEEYFAGILNQLREGSCAGFSVTEFTEIHWGSTHGERLPVRLAPAYPYARARMAEGTWPQDSGSSLADEFGVAFAFGIPCETDMPYTGDASEPIPPIADAAAAHYRIPHASTVDMSDFDASARVLDAGLPISFAIPVYESFEDCPSNGELPLPDPTREAFLGLHALTCCGRNLKTRQRRVINHWGVTWGDCGFCWLPEGYPVVEALTAPKG